MCSQHLRCINLIFRERIKLCIQSHYIEPEKLQPGMRKKVTDSFEKSRRSTQSVICTRFSFATYT